MSCRICFDGVEGAATGPVGTLVPASRLAPRHVGGNEDEPGEWIPICEAHVADWYEDVPESERMPMLRLPSVFEAGPDY